MKTKQLVLITITKDYIDERCLEQSINIDERCLEQNIKDQNIYELIEKYANIYCGFTNIEYIREWRDVKGNIIYDFGSPDEFFEVREV